VAIKLGGGKRGGGGLKRNMLQLNIPDEEILYQSYLPFLQQGGLFIPTDKKYQLGDEVFVLLTIPFLKTSEKGGDKRPVAGKVVWINPKGSQGNRPAGIGVQFGEIDKGELREDIEKALADKLRLDKNTYTM